MFWLLLLGLGFAAFAGGDTLNKSGGSSSGGGSGGGDGPPSDVTQWVENGIQFAWSSSSKKLTAEAAPDGAIKVYEVGTYETLEAAQLAAKAWLPPVVEPTPQVPIPTPDPPEGASAPVACEMVKADGPYAICLYKQGDKWGFRATDASGQSIATANDFPSMLDAKLGAWQMLLAFPAQVVPAVDRRHGMKLEPNGTVRLEPGKVAVYKAKAMPVLAGEIAKGETDPAGLILAVLGATWPNVNLFRLRPDGGTLAQAAAKAAPHVGDAEAFADAMLAKQAGISGTPGDAGGVQEGEPAPGQSSGAIGADVQLGPAAELKQYTRQSDNSKWWVITTSEPVLTPGGDPSVVSTWRVWGPNAAIATGTPAGQGSTGSRAQSVDAAHTWIEAAA